MHALKSLLCCVVCCFNAVASTAALAGEMASMRAARETITSKDLKGHATVLASDTFEGREAGSRGGRAIGAYIGKQLRDLRLAGAGEDRGYYQEFGEGYRNILAKIEGADPELAEETIIVGAHYDHVGYGNSRNSRGPIGIIHNGADDNASGTSVVLEVAEAFVALGQAPRRTVVFAFWDAEEKGLLGSKHWISEPTFPFRRVKFLLNLDMVGRLRDNRLTVHGARTAPGLRQFVSAANDADGPDLDFSWEIKGNTDHYPFFEQRVPFISLFTRLHDDYHRPSDDVHRLNFEGMQQVSRLLFGLAVSAANADRLPEYRSASVHETASLQKQVERPLGPLPPRLGISWDADLAEEGGGIRVTGLLPDAPASEGGLRAGDLITQFDGRSVTSSREFLRAVLEADNPVSVRVRRPGAADPVGHVLELAGQPVRVGIEWRNDDAEPGSVILKRVVQGSRADAAGLQTGDRIVGIDGEPITTNKQFHERITAETGTIALLVERDGKMQRLVLEPFRSRPPAPPLPN